VSAAEVQAELGAHEALVLLLDTDDRFRPLPEETFIWVVTKTDVRWVRSELGTVALGREVAALRCGLDATLWLDASGWSETTAEQKRGKAEQTERRQRCLDLLKTEPEYDREGNVRGDTLPFDLARAHKLHAALFGEVEDLIKGKHLLIVPSGPLTQLPFQILVTALPPGVMAGETSREVGRLGAELAQLTEEDRKTLPASMGGGVRVVRPIAGGPAEAAGLRAGDILLGLDQHDFATVGEAVATVQAAGSGRKVSVKVIREGKNLAVPVTLGAITVKDWKPLLIDVSQRRQTAWLAREHAITILPAVSSLKALRRVSKSSAAPRPMIGIGNPLLDGPDARYANLAKQARAKQRCPAQRPKQVAARGDARTGAAPIVMRAGLADVADIKGQVPLPETADELCAVAQDVKADTGRDILLGAKATEREVKRLGTAGELAKYRMVHFATHGVVAGDLKGVTEPGLILTPPDRATEEDDGYLSASEIAALKLDADWVILSACNTAAGAATSAEALSGLARAFIYAQARALLVSHWEVYSDATVKLVTGAVREIARDPKIGRAEALRRSMLALIDKGTAQESHPAYWAPFVLVGEGGQGR
jgi:CHAT domain-containing protein